MPDEESRMASALGAEETLVTSAGVPVLARIVSGRRDRPLVVFLPGAGHLARIAYGHPGADRTEFLSHWVNERGFAFLALSYPGSHPVFPDARPGLTAQQWAAAAAAETARQIDEHGLAPRVVLCVWSMAGRHVHPFTRAAAALGLTVDVCISLAASAPLPGAGVVTRPTFTPDGLWDMSGHRTRFLQELFEHADAPPPFSQAEFAQFYIQHHSSALRADVERLDERGRAHIDPDVASDIGIGRWHEFPTCAAIVPLAQRDLRHSLGDQVTWPLITVLGAIARLEANGKDMDHRTWRQLRHLIDSASQELIHPVEGGHFFFVGADGARRTAGIIDELWRRAVDLQRRAHRICGESHPLAVGPATSPQQAGHEENESVSEQEVGP